MASGHTTDTGYIATPGYHGPDRRVAERRTGSERRQNRRFGYGWWDDPDRRSLPDRRRG